VSIKQWNPQQSDALLRILLELLSCFRDYQKQLIAKFPNDRIRFECETVANVEGVEMYLNTVGSHHEVDCMVPLNDVNLLQLSGLSICLPVAGPHGNTDSSVYSLTLYAKFFPDITDKEPELSLVIPKFWEEKLPFLSHLKLPEWTKNMCLVEYISQIKDTLTEVFDGLKLRKRLILEFKNQMEASPLEYDSMTYRRISFLYVVDSVPVVLHGNEDTQREGKALWKIGEEERADVAFRVMHDTVFVPWLFPKECPQLLLQSVMYSGSGHPLQRLIVDYPYSPRWDVTELVRRLKALLPNNLIQFKRECEVSRSNG
jgi:BRCA1-A complex subunit BRE